MALLPFGVEGQAAPGERPVTSGTTELGLVQQEWVAVSREPRGDPKQRARDSARAGLCVLHCWATGAAAAWGLPCI